MADLNHMTDDELGGAIGAYFDRAARPVDAGLIADRAIAGRRLAGPSIDLPRLVLAVAVAALLLLAGYQTARFVGSILERSELPPIDVEPSPTGHLGDRPRGMLAIPTTDGINLVDVDTGTLLRTVVADPSAFCVGLSPDGSTLSYFVGSFNDLFAEPSTSAMQLVELGQSGTGDVATEVTGPFWAKPPSWSPDGTTFVAIHDSTPPEASGGMGGQSSTVWLHDRSGLAVRELYSRGETQHAAFSPDGDWIALTTRMELVAVRTDGSKVVHLARHDPRPSSRNAPTWSPDGSLIAYAVGPGDRNSWDVHVVDFATGADRELVNLALAYYPRWSPRGDWIATTPPRGGGIDLIDPVTGAAHMLNTAGANHAWTLDGSAIAIATADTILAYTPSGELILEIPAGIPIGPTDCPLAISR